MFKIDKAMFCVVLIVCLIILTSGPVAAAVRIDGQVQVGGGPLANSTVTLWAASTADPKQLAQTTTSSDGRFKIDSQETVGADVILYLLAKGGVATVNKGSGENPAVALLSVLGNTPPSTVVINELTTVASAFTSARFIKGEAISGNPLGLRIAAGNAPNLVDPATGKWGKVLLDPLNSSMTTTLAKLDTLGSLITYAAVANDDWRARFFKAATPTGGVTPKNTLEAMAGIAREPWPLPKSFTDCMTKLIRTRHPMHGAVVRPSRRIWFTFRTTSPSRCPSRAAAIMPMDVLCLMRTVISGAVRTGCPARSPALTGAPVVA